MNNELKKRFVNDNKIPINVFEEEHWNYQLDLFEGYFKSRTAWNNLCSGIKEEYDGNPDLFLKAFYDRRERMIQEIGNNAPPSYKSGENKIVAKEYIRSKFYDITQDYLSTVQRKDLYNKENLESWFLSIDLVKANFQALRWYYPDFFPGVKKEESTQSAYLSWLSYFEKPEEKCLNSYIKSSKYFREVVFGNLNPDRQIRIEHWMIAKVCDKVKEILDQENAKYLARQHGSDEVVLEVEDYEHINSILPKIKEATKFVEGIGQVDVKIELYKLSGLDIKTWAGKDVDAYRKLYLDGSFTLKSIDKHYFPQIYEFFMGIEPDKDDRDLVFNHGCNEPAKFIHRLVRKSL